MTVEKKLKIFRIIKIVLLIIYLPLILIYLGVFLPEYLACVGVNQDGAFGTNIWGNKVECFGESRGLGDGLFIIFSQITAAFSVLMIALFLGYYYFKRK